MSSQAAEFLAADLVVRSSVVIPNAWLEKADKLGLNRAYTAEFSTVLIENDELLLAGIKAVSGAYPLRGHLKTKDAPESTSVQQTQGPEAGSVWVDNRVLTTLKLSMGDVVTIGEKPLTVNRIITYEPDKRGDIYSLSPRVLMNEADLLATKVLEPGSRVHYFFQFSGELAAISAFNQWVKPQLNVSQRVMDVQDDRPELGSALSRAERYLGLSSILVVLIAGVAIAMSSRRFTERHFNSTAIMRCMGCKQQDMVMIFLYQFVVLGLLACSVGLLQGWFAQEVLFNLLRSLLPAKVSEPSMIAVMFGFVTGFTILIGFALPPLLRLKRVSPLRVLRRELDPINNSSWFVYGLALLLLAGLVLQYTGDLKLMLTIIGGGLLAIVLSGGLVFAVLKQLNKLLPHLSLGGRLGFQGLLSNPTLSTVQIMAFSITLVAMLLSFTVRNDLLSDWQKQLPDDAPNYFALNIFPNQIASFEEQLEAFSIPAANIYPIVRGRLVEINSDPVQRHVTKESQGERAIHRDLSLTW
jgi:putative ABC transport system permease protein